MRLTVLLFVTVTILCASLVAGASGGILEFLDLSLWGKKTAKKEVVDDAPAATVSTSSSAQNKGGAVKSAVDAKTGKAIEFVDLNATPSKATNLRATTKTTADDVTTKKTATSTAQKVEFIDLSAPNANAKPVASAAKTEAAAATTTKKVEFVELTPSTGSKPSAAAPAAASKAATATTAADSPTKTAGAAKPGVEFLDLADNKKPAATGAAATAAAASAPAAKTTGPASALKPDVEFLDVKAATKAAPAAPAAAAAPVAKAAAASDASAAAKPAAAAATAAAASKPDVKFVELAPAASAGADTKAAATNTAAKPAAAAPAAAAAKPEVKFVELAPAASTTPSATAGATKAAPAAPAAASKPEVKFVELAPAASTTPSATAGATKAAPAAPAAPAAASKPEVKFVELAPAAPKTRRLQEVQFLDLGEAEDKKKPRAQQGEREGEGGARRGSRGTVSKARAEENKEKDSKAEAKGEVQFLDIPAKKEEKANEAVAAATPVTETAPAAADASAKAAKKSEDAEMQFLDIPTTTSKKEETKATPEVKEVTKAAAEVKEEAKAKEEVKEDAKATAELKEEAKAATEVKAEVKEEVKAKEEVKDKEVKAEADAEAKPAAKSAKANDVEFLDVAPVAKKTADVSKPISSPKAEEEKDTQAKANVKAAAKEETKPAQVKAEAKEEAKGVSTAKVLIFGIDDLLGANIAQLLLSMSGVKYEVYGIPSPSSSTASPLAQNSVYAGIASRVKVLDVDVLDKLFVYNTIQAIKPAFIFQCVQTPSPVLSTPNALSVATTPEHMVHAHVDSTVHALEGVIRAGLQNSTRVYVAGSYLEYSAAAVESGKPVSESADLDGTGVYGIAMVAAEKIALQYAKEQGVQVLVGRHFPILGKSPVVTSSLQAYCQQVARMEASASTTLPSLPSAAVYDVLDASDAAAGALSVIFKGEVQGVYNIGRGQGLRAKDVVSKLVSLAGLKDVTVPAQVGEGGMVADVTKLTALQFKPAKSIVDTLQEELDFWREAVKSA